MKVKKAGLFFAPFLGGRTQTARLRHVVIGPRNMIKKATACLAPVP